MNRFALRSAWTALQLMFVLFWESIRYPFVESRLWINEQGQVSIERAQRRREWAPLDGGKQPRMNRLALLTSLPVLILAASVWWEILT